MDLILLKQLGIALLLAALLGLERESSVTKDKRKRFAGIRTFTLIGLFGALSQFLMVYSEALSLLLVSGFFLFIIAAYVVTSLITKTGGATTELAAFIVFVNGILCAHEQYVLATVITLIVLFVLHFRTKLQGFASKISKREMVSTIQFMLVAFVVLPLLPDKGFGPYEVFNPYLIWLMVVLVSGISYVSYMAIKLIGAKKGIGLTGFFAGLISSTALTMSFSSQSKKNKKIVNPYVFAIVVASSATFFRILVEVSVINKALLYPLLVPMLAMGVSGSICAIFFWTREDERGKKLAESVKMESPFQLRPALKFGAFFAVILFLSKVLGIYFGSKGLYFASVLSGLADVDAITVSVANLSKNGLSEGVAINAITIAAITNMFVKAFIFAIFGHRKVAKKIAIVFGVMLLFGVIALLFV